jgi:hypothetical protein
MVLPGVVGAAHIGRVGPGVRGSAHVIEMTMLTPWSGWWFQLAGGTGDIGREELRVSN